MEDPAADAPSALSLSLSALSPLSLSLSGDDELEGAVTIRIRQRFEQKHAHSSLKRTVVMFFLALRGSILNFIRPTLKRHVFADPERFTLGRFEVGKRE